MGFKKRSDIPKTSRLNSIVLFLLVAIIPTLGQTAGKSETNVRVALSQPLTVRWHYDSNLTLNLTPAFDQQRIYLPLAGGIIVSLKADNGQLNWRSEMGGELSASPVADDQAVYVASETGKSEAGARRATGTLRSLSREGGVTQWMRTLAMPLRGSLTLANGKILAGGSDGRVYAFNVGSGELRWVFSNNATFLCQPAVYASRVYLGSEDGALLVLDEGTGKLLWRYRTKGPIRGPVAMANDAIYFGSGDGYVYALNAATGHLLWRKRTGAGVQAVARVDDALLVASLDNFVYLFSLNGSKLWKRQLPGRISSQPLTAADGALFTPLSSSAAVVLGLRDGRPVNSLPTGEEITTSASPVAIGNAVFLTTEHGLLAFAQPRENGSAKGR